MSLRLTSLAIAATTLFSSSVHAFNQNARTNLAVYWGQNSYGATHGSDQANWQQNIDYYCQDDTIDAIPIAFLTVAFSTGNLPSIDVSNICSVNSNSVFPGTNLPDCSALASKIQTCQSKGKIVTLSIGGATGGVSPTSTAQAVQLADNVWNLFLGGSSSTRPFGSAVLDGVDLDIEGGTSAFWGDFVKEIRAKSNGASKKYYVTGAPQCVFPDAYLGTALNQVAFDAVYVQFYNNWCGVQNFNNPNAWNFGAWDSWAKSSPNPNVKVYIGVPGAPTAAGSGYVDAGTLTNIIKSTAAQYSSFGGVMMWDASQAYANGRFDKAIKSALLANVGGGGSQPGTTTAKPPATTTKVTTPPPTTTSKPPTGSCGSVPGWVANVAYVAGDQVLYNGALWTATQWNYASAPGGAAGAWTRVGACASAQASRLKPSLDLNYTPTVPTPTVSPAAARRDVFRFKRD